MAHETHNLLLLTKLKSVKTIEAERKWIQLNQIWNFYICVVIWSEVEPVWWQTADRRVSTCRNICVPAKKIKINKKTTKKHLWFRIEI